ncbi:MAG: putative lipid II flippase FtsW [Brevinema sp.]
MSSPNSTPVFDSSALSRMNKTIFYLYCIFVVIGLIFMYSVSRYSGRALNFTDNAIFIKQFFFALISAFSMLIFAQLDYRLTRVVIKPLFFLSLFLLILVFIPGIGLQIGLARRWINLHFLSFNPSEFAKITLIIYLAHIFVKKHENIANFVSGLLPPLILVALVFGIILLQSGFSIGAIIVIVMFTMIFAGGASLRHIFSIILLTIPILILAIWNVTYRKDRILAYLDPWRDPSGIGYQSIESLRALAHGGFFGVGLGNSIQKISRLPAAHTDFIFAIIIEEVGLWGGLILMGLFMWFFREGLRVAFRIEDPYGRLLSFGITTLIITHALLNMMINMGLLPPTGVSLPFISYGGSSFVMLSIAIGILLNISSHISQKR